MRNYENWTRNDFRREACDGLVADLQHGGVTVNALIEALGSGEIYDHAYQYGDGHAAAIYYHNAIDLFRNGLTDEYEEEAMSQAVSLAQSSAYTPSLQEVISHAAAMFLSAVYTDAVWDVLHWASDQGSPEAREYLGGVEDMDWKPRRFELS